MSKVITSAGREAPVPADKPRREVIARIRQVLRDSRASDAQVEDALEALTELAKTGD